MNSLAKVSTLLAFLAIGLKTTSARDCDFPFGIHFLGFERLCFTTGQPIEQGDLTLFPIDIPMQLCPLMYDTGSITNLFFREEYREVIDFDNFFVRFRGENIDTLVCDKETFTCQYNVAELKTALLERVLGGAQWHAGFW